MSIVKTVSYIDASNDVKLQLQDNSTGEMANTLLESADSIDVVIEGVTYSSKDHAEAITWTPDGIVTIQFYQFFTKPGVYDAHIKVYFGNQTSGKRWDDDLRINVPR